MSSHLDFRVQVLLSMQRALWDMVTPTLRGVAVSVDYPSVKGRLLYENVPTSEELEINAEVETYVIADFDESVRVTFRAECVPQHEPRDLLQGEEWVYLRREP